MSHFLWYNVSRQKNLAFLQSSSGENIDREKRCSRQHISIRIQERVRHRLMSRPNRLRNRLVLGGNAVNLRKLGASILIATSAVLIVGSVASASTPNDTIRAHVARGVQKVTLTSGHPILVIHDDPALCDTLIKPKKRIKRDFKTVTVENVVIDANFCFASWYAPDEMPNLVFNYRNAVLGAPGISRRYSRGELFYAANEGLVLWFNRPGGWFMLGVPPFLSPTATLKEIAIYLTGYPDTYCLDTIKDKLTSDRIVRYGYAHACPPIEFIDPTNWFTNDELSTWPYTHRDPGSMVSSKKFKLVLDRTIYDRAVYDLFMRTRMDGGPKNARLIRAVNAVKAH